jgi:allantoin racemase
MKQLRILNIVPDIYTEGIEASVKDRKVLAKKLHQDTNGLIQLETRLVDGGSESIECFYDSALAAPYILRLAKQGQEEGFDAIVLDCFLDPAMSECRELLEIPVLGACQSSCFLAARIGGEFSIIGILDNADRCIKENLRKYGLIDYLISIPVIDTPVVELHRDEAALANKIISVAYKAVKDDKARALIFGCTSMSTLVEPVRDGLKDRGLDVQIIEPFQAALYDAVACVMQGVSQSKSSYWPIVPKKRELDWKQD